MAGFGGEDRRARVVPWLLGQAYAQSPNRAPATTIGHFEPRTGGHLVRKGLRNRVGLQVQCGGLDGNVGDELMPALARGWDKPELPITQGSALVGAHFRDSRFLSGLTKPRPSRPGEYPHST